MISVRYATKYGVTLSVANSDSIPELNDIVTIAGEDYTVVNIAGVVDGVCDAVVEVWKDVNGKEGY